MNELPTLRRALSFLILTSCAFAQTPAVDATQKTLNRTCFGCHNENLKSGNLSIQGLKTSDMIAATPEWEKILRKVRSGEMPPINGPKLTDESRTALLAHVEKELDHNFAVKPDPGTPSIHRLNRVEYSNSIRDILALDLDHSASLPTDDSGFGFDNIGSVLSTSPMLLEKYLSTARRVSRLAIGTVKAAPAIERYTPRSREALSSDSLPLSVRNGLAISRYFPLDAEYSILIRIRGTPDPILPVSQLDVRVDGVRTKLLDANVDPAEENQVTRNFEFRIPVKAGMHSIGAGLLVESPKSESGVQQRRGFGPPPSFGISVEYITIGGPFNPQGPGETPSRKRIFACRPLPISLKNSAPVRSLHPSLAVPIAALFSQQKSIRSSRSLPQAAKTATALTQALKTLSAPSSSRPTFSSAWKKHRLACPPAQTTKSPISNSHRDSHSSFGPASPTTSCYASLPIANCVQYSPSRSSGCSPTARPQLS